MSDIFISYARSTEAQARQIAEALRGLGYGVWRDDELPAHRAYADVIEERLIAAKAVVVVWSAEAAKSEWVRSEADRAREAHKLVQLRLDSARLPMPFDQIQCADLVGWTGDQAHPGWRKVAASIADLTRATPREPTAALRTPTIAPLSLPDKPSIAVLPFADPGGATEGDYFADGMVDEIVTALAKFSALFVIGSSSSLSYRERERDVAEIGRELGVRYLLEGAVRRSGPRVRISVRLVEAAGGAQIWADRFDGTLEDVFALQDEVANAVAARIEPTIQAADRRRGAARPTADQSAYDLFLRARQRLLEYDKESWPIAKALFEQAVARDPAYALAWAVLAMGEILSANWGWSPDPEGSRREAQDAMRHALNLDGDDPEVMILMSLCSLMLGSDPRTCEAMADRALQLNPGSAQSWAVGGNVALMAGQPERALERFRHALRLDPRAADRHSLVLGIGSALAWVDRYDEAVPWLEEALALRPNNPASLYSLVDAYTHVGRIEDARTTLVRAEALLPAKFWIATGLTLPGMRAEGVERHRATFRSLGVDV